MSDTVFRSQPTPAQVPVVVSKNDPATMQDPGIEVPYLDYESEHGKPYLVDHFQLGDHWQDDMGGFAREVSMISNYIEGRIKDGEIANSPKAVAEMIRGMEKFNNLTKEERTVVKMEVLSHYVEFLQKNDVTRRNLRRYSAY